MSINKIIGVLFTCSLLVGCYRTEPTKQSPNKLFVRDLTLSQRQRDDKMFLVRYNLFNVSDENLYLVENEKEWIVSFYKDIKSIKVGDPGGMYEKDYYPYKKDFLEPTSVIGSEDSAEYYYNKALAYLKNNSVAFNKQKNKQKVFYFPAKSRITFYKLLHFYYSDLEHLTTNKEKVSFIFNERYFDQNDSLINEHLIVPDYTLNHR